MKRRDLLKKMLLLPAIFIAPSILGGTTPKPAYSSERENKVMSFSGDGEQETLNYDGYITVPEINKYPEYRGFTPTFTKKPNYILGGKFKPNINQDFKINTHDHLIEYVGDGEIYSIKEFIAFIKEDEFVLHSSDGDYNITLFNANLTNKAYEHLKEGTVLDHNGRYQSIVSINH